MRIGLKIKLKNDHLLSAMKSKGVKNARDLSIKAGISLNSAYRFINLKTYPRSLSFQSKIEKFFQLPIEILFPDDLKEAVDKKPKTDFYAAKEVSALPLQNQPELLMESTIVSNLNEDEMAKKLNEVLETITEKEKDVLKLRFGMADGTPHTLREVGDKYKVSANRIMQIEAKALRKLRHPTRSRPLQEFAQSDVVESWVDKKTLTEYKKRISEYDKSIKDLNAKLDKKEDKRLRERLKEEIGKRYDLLRRVTWEEDRIMLAEENPYHDHG